MLPHMQLWIKHQAITYSMLVCEELQLSLMLFVLDIYDCFRKDTTVKLVLGSHLKADMKSYKSLETTAIFYSSEPFLKQGIS